MPRVTKSVEALFAELVDAGAWSHSASQLQGAHDEDLFPPREVESPTRLAHFQLLDQLVGRGKDRDGIAVELAVAGFSCARLRDAIARLSAVGPLGGILDDVQAEDRHAAAGYYGPEVEQAADVLARAAAASERPEQAHPFVATVRQFAANPVDPEAESTGVVYSALSDIVAGAAGVDPRSIPAEDLAAFIGTDPYALRDGLAEMGKMLSGRLPDEALKEALMQADLPDLVAAVQMAPAFLSFYNPRNVGPRQRHIVLANHARSLLFFLPLLKSFSLGPVLRRMAAERERLEAEGRERER